MYYLNTLGGLGLLRVGDGRGEVQALANSKTLLILAVLARRPDHSEGREFLAEFLWPGSDRSRARRALRQALFFLTHHAEGVLERSNDRLRLNPGELNVDLWEFDGAIERQDYRKALALYRGPFAAGAERKVGVEAEHWIEAEQARVFGALAIAYPKEVDRRLQEGDDDGAAQVARDWVQRDPLNDDAQQILIRTLAASGDPVEAVRTFEVYRTQLQSASEPVSRELQHTIDQVRAEATASPDARAPEPRGRAPGVMVTSPLLGINLPTIRFTDRRTILGAAAALVALTAAGMAVGRSAWRSLRPELLNARILARDRAAPGAPATEIVITAGRVQLRARAGLDAATLASPDGRRVAVGQAASDGWNVILREGRALVPVTSEPGDEFPVTWSPDGRYLLYAKGRLAAGGGRQSFTLELYDVERRVARRLTQLSSAEPPAAAWSPDGTQIAFSADVRGVPDIFLVDFEGDSVRAVAAHRSWDGAPAWSPQGEHLVFVSRRSGNGDLYVARRDGADLRRLTFTDAAEQSPIWVAATAVVYLAERGEDRELRAINPFSGESRRLAADVPVTSLTGALGQPQRWIESLRIRPRPAVTSPGQYIRFDLALFNPLGEKLAPAGFPIRWTVVRPEMARFSSPALLQVLDQGSTQLVATVAGWRSDTLTLWSLPLLERMNEPAFIEDWQHDSLVSARWRFYGDPTPWVSPRGGPDGGVLVNRGDAFFASGAVTRHGRNAGRGITVEARGRMPFTGKLHQAFSIALYDQELSDATLAAEAVSPVVGFRVVGPTHTGPARATIVTGTEQVTVPVPPGPAQWHTYALQIQPDGTLEVLVDGRTYWRSAAPAQMRRSPRIYVALGSQSLDTDIAHGVVRMFDEPKYLLPALISPSPPN